MDAFENLPTPLLVLTALASGFLLCLNLLIPDPLPLLDEAMLLFVVLGSSRPIFRRVGGHALSSPGQGASFRTLEEMGVRERRRRAASLTGLPGRCSILVAKAQSLEITDGLGPSTQSLERLTGRVDELCTSRSELISLFGVNRNDPPLVRRRIMKLTEKIGRVQQGGSSSKLSKLRKQLGELQAHERSLREQAERLTRVTQELVEVDEQVAAASMELDRLLKDGLSGASFEILLRPGLAPELAHFFGRIREFGEAEAEIDDRVVTASARSAVRLD